MGTKLEQLNQRLGKPEEQNDQEVLTLIEILSNATFFGEMKKINCESAKNGQCGFFVLKTEAQNKIPVVTECRIRSCKEPSFHYHIEPSNITCTLCQKQSVYNFGLFEELEPKKRMMLKSNLIENKSYSAEKIKGMKK